MTTPNPPSRRGAQAALLAAFLGWLFDGFEMGLFPLIGRPALQDLLPDASPAVQGQWFTIIIAVFLVGAATGGVLFGWLGDKLGRVKAMAMAIITPNMTNNARQPQMGISHCTGKVAASMPSEPVISIQELVRNWVLASNQRR
jgi:MFS family permease